MMVINDGDDDDDDDWNEDEDEDEEEQEELEDDDDDDDDDDDGVVISHVSWAFHTRFMTDAFHTHLFGHGSQT